jgi:dephospho-CoA kinase
MIVLGLTGSIGMGKSTTANMFRELGIDVYDSDLSVHELYSGEALIPLSAQFPDAVEGSQIDRKKLGDIVFKDKSKLLALEKILHPLVRRKEDIFLENCRKAQKQIVVLDIPLLFEKRERSDFDYIIVVTTSAEQQKDRVLSRPGMTEDKFNSILAQQIPDAHKRKAAHFIVDTQKGLDSARQQVRAIVRSILGHD